MIIIYPSPQLMNNDLKVFNHMEMNKISEALEYFLTRLSSY